MMILAIDPKYFKVRGRYGSKKVDGLTKDQRHYLRHREECIATTREYKATRKPEIATYMREYRKKHPERIKGYEGKRVRPSEQKEKFNLYCAKWHRENPDKRLASYQKRRAKVKETTLTVCDIKELRERQKGICYYCWEPLDNNNRGHLEHKTPLARGGRHDKGNVVFSCSSCNLKKGQKTEKEFLCLS